MNVSADLRKRVEDKITWCIEVCEKKYNQAFRRPKVTYNKRGTTAGVANYHEWTIDLNAVLLIENGEAFINRTVVHEWAHLVTDQVYPEAHRPTSNNAHSYFRTKRVKRSPHGTQWQSVMRVLGADPSRCHSYDVANVQRKVDMPFVYKCNCRSHIPFSLKRHNKHQAGVLINPISGGYRCSRCKTQLTFVKKEGSTVSIPKAVVTSNTVPLGGRFKSKLDIARHIMKFSNGKSRQQLISEMVAEAGCTPAGAATYYSKLKAEMGL